MSWVSKDDKEENRKFWRFVCEHFGVNAFTSVQLRNFINSVGNGHHWNWTLLQHAVCYRESARLAERLIAEYGADVNAAIRGRNTTSLVYATEGSSIELAHLLLRYGACLDPPGVWASPLDVACLNGSVEMASFLLDHGADYRNLHHCIKYGSQLPGTPCGDLIARIARREGRARMARIALLYALKQPPWRAWCARGVARIMARMVWVERRSDVWDL